jgi:aspartate aminotransferase
VQKLQSQSTSNPTSIVQKAAVAALNSSQRCVEDMRQEYIKLRDHIVGGLRAIPGVKCTMPEGAFYAYPNVSAFFGKNGINSAADIAHGLLHKAHVATVAGEGFGTTDHVRISYATTMENLDRALDRMRKYFGSL